MMTFDRMTRRDPNLEEMGKRLKAVAPAEPMSFPDITPSSIKRSRGWHIWAPELAETADVDRLLELMFLNPEGQFFLFHAEKSLWPRLVRDAFDSGLIRDVELQGHWFEHPLYPGNFVRIMPTATWDWEREVLEKGQPLMRCEVVLTDRERRRRENEETARSVAEAARPRTPKTWYESFGAHFQRHQAAYAVAGLLVGIFGLAALI